MAYCTNCGNPVADNQNTCFYCGKVFTPVVESKPVVSADETGSFLYAILGFVFPVVGLILYAVWVKSRPKTAKMAGIAALISFLLMIVLYFILLIWVIGNTDFTYTIPKTGYNI